ncbi:MAG: carboxypeptidase regulatory-like domain-containing protein [Chloroflexi bacterium]|nr:carboxypeptidase regulatory-like domain-containing protein [Chloroflexota bacterium]
MAWLVAVLAATLVTGCGTDSNQPGGLEGQVLGMLSPTEQPVLLEGAVIALSGPGGSQVTQTDADGRYRFDALRPGAYGFAASYTGPLSSGRPLQSEERRFTVSPGQDETISVVLLADGITPPPAPPDAPVAGNAATSAVSGGGGGLTGNPFFWYFLFNQPWAYGYGRAPVIVRDPGGPVVVDRSQPQRSTAGRPYSDYDPTGSVGTRTKAPPEVTSKGTTRPGATGGGAARPAVGATPAIRPPASGGSAPAAKPPTSGSDSKGVTRPGSNSAPSVKPPTSRPPAVRPPSIGRRR